MPWPCLAAGRPDRTPADGVLLRLAVVPGARKTGADGLFDGALRVRLSAPPVDGKANEALLGFLADALGVPRSRLELVSGQTSRKKRVAVAGLAPAEAVARLLPDGGV